MGRLHSCCMYYGDMFGSAYMFMKSLASLISLTLPWWHTPYTTFWYAVQGAEAVKHLIIRQRYHNLGPCIDYPFCHGIICAQFSLYPSLHWLNHRELTAECIVASFITFMYVHHPQVVRLIGEVLRRLLWMNRSQIYFVYQLIGGIHVAIFPFW